MRKLKTQALKVILFTLCLLVTVIYCSCAAIFFMLAVPYYALVASGVPLLTVFLLAAWWLSMRKSWRACMVSGLLAELSFVLQAVVYIYLIASFTTGTPATLYITGAAVLLLMTAVEFALVWIIQRRTYEKFRDAGFVSAPAQSRGRVLAYAWMAVGAVCAVCWIIFLAMRYGSMRWPLTLGAVPFILCLAAFCYAWWMSAYRGKVTRIIFTVLLGIISFALFIDGVYLGYRGTNVMYVVIAFTQSIWFILFIALGVYRTVRNALDRRGAAHPVKAAEEG